MDGLKVYSISCDGGDYAPILVCTEQKILLCGDNTHNVGWEYFVEGYEEGTGVVAKNIIIYDSESLAEAEPILRKHDMYDDFKEYGGR